MAYLSEVAAEYTKRGGAPLAVVVYGSASAVLRHEFRGTTHDIDYSIPEPSDSASVSLFADCVDLVGKRHDLFPRWMHSVPHLWEEPQRQENLRRHVEPLSVPVAVAGRPETVVSHVRQTIAVGVVAWFLQDDEWLLAASLCYLRRYNRDAGNIIGILMEERPRGRFLSADDLRRTVWEVYGGDMKWGWEGEALLALLGPEADLRELFAFHRRRTEYYKDFYRFFSEFVRAKCADARIAARIWAFESLAWRTKEDILRTFAAHGMSLSPKIASHFARHLFETEYASMCQPEATKR